MTCDVNAEEPIKAMPLDADFRVAVAGKDTNPGNAARRNR